MKYNESKKSNKDVKGSNIVSHLWLGTENIYTVHNNANTKY